MASSDDEFVLRPFAAVPGEESWVAVREILPAATMTVRTDADHGDVEVTVASALPGLWPGWRRADGKAYVGLQTNFSSSDRGRDVAAAILATIAAQPDTAVESIDLGQGPALAEILAGEPGAVSVEPDYGFWTAGLPEGGAGETGDLAKAVLDQAGDVVTPSAAIDQVPGAYWAQLGGKEFVRWVRGEDEDALFDALARLHAVRTNQVVPGAKYAGAFRACGLVIPVWELPRGTSAADASGPVAEFATRLDAALAETGDLSALERQARSGLVSRSVTLR